MFRFNKSNIADDNELIASYRSSGDTLYVGELYKKYSYLVYCVCMKYLKDEDECKDAVMQIFEKLIEDLKKHQVSNFKCWIQSVARNHCLMNLRSVQSTYGKNDEYKKDFPVIMESYSRLHPDTDNNDEDFLSLLDGALDKLNDEQKICIDLFYLQGKCYQDVTDATGYSMMQVKSYIQNGKRNLKNIIQNQYEQQAK